MAVEPLRKAAARIGTAPGFWGGTGRLLTHRQARRKEGDSNRGLEADTSEMPYDLSEGGVQHTNSKGPARAGPY